MLSADLHVPILAQLAPTITLGVYARAFNKTDAAAAQAIEAALRMGSKPGA